MLSLVIQAGGESRRMGKDKALALFLGRPLIERVQGRVARLADEVLVTTNKPQDYGFLGLPLFSDIVAGRGALGGLYTALSSAAYPLVAVVACDMPFVNAELLAYQLQMLVEQEYDAVIPKTGSGAEPFHAVYRRDTCLAAVRAAVEADKWRVDAWFPAAKIRFLSLEEQQQYDPERLAFSNVNTPEELAEAERIALLKDEPPQAHRPPHF